MIASLSGLVDTAFQRLLVERQFLSSRADVELRWLEEAGARLDDLPDDELFCTSQPADIAVVYEGRYHGHKTQRLDWQMPRHPLSEVFGLTCRTGAPTATLFGEGGRPVWLLVHGWLGGSRFMDEIFWPMRALLETHDVALLTLPGHGRRSLPTKAMWPTFPGRNPVRNVLGLLTAVTETAQLLRFLGELGYQRVGVAGSSLGVQVTALLATLGSDATRWLFDRPLVDLSQPLRRRVDVDRPDLLGLLLALQGLYRRLSPLHRPSQVSPSQVDVLLGLKDGVVGLREGEALADHFGVVPQSFPTGHVLSVGRKNVALELLRRLR